MRIESDLHENFLGSGKTKVLRNANFFSAFPEENGFLAEKVQISAMKQRSHEEFMKSLQQDTAKEKIRIEKEMSYLYKTFEDCGFLIEFQDHYVQEIDKSLKEAEKNSESLIKTLKSSSDKASCQQRILNSIIITLAVFVVILVVLAFIKS